MKFTVKLKFLIYIFFLLKTSIRLCSSEDPTPFKGNITPVKLYHLNYSSKHLPNSAIGSVAKVSRVVPLKQLSQVKYNFRNSSKSELKNVGFVKPVKLKSSKKHGIPKVGSRTPSRSSTRSRLHVKPNEKKAKTLIAPPPTLPEHEHKAITSATPPSSEIVAVSESSNNVKEPTHSSANSWDYLTSVANDHELQQIMFNLSDEIIQNAAMLTRLDPAEGQKYILNSAISQLGEKHSRMMELDPANQTINNGVRFSPKMKPILNVSRLEEVTINNADHGIISGHLTNAMKVNPRTVFNSDKEDMDITAGQSSTQVKEIIPVPSSTTPTLMQVLSVPEEQTLQSTTTTPPDSLTLVKGFVPSFSTPSKIDQLIGENSADIYITTRKARGPPKELEYQYQIPFITSTSTAEPEVDKGYQTIIESTTMGPKVIWYNHKQTPEDTFFPNSDGYLTPPEELPIEVISENFSLKPIKDNLIIDLTTQDAESDSSFGENGNGDTFASSSKYGNGRGYKGHRLVPSSSLLSTKHGMKMTKSNIRLQPAATVIDHNGIREFYEDEFSKNGGGDGKRLRPEFLPHQREKGHYGSVPYYADIKEHEIVPTQEQKPYSQDDTKSNPAFHEYQDTYHDSYPPPSNDDEISSSHPNNYNQQQRPTSGNNYYKEEVNRPPYRDAPASADVDYNRRPALEVEKYKEGSPGGGYGQGHGNGPYNPGHHYGYGYQGDKGYFSKAKEYFKNSDFSTAEKWFDVSIGILAFLAFGGYIIMLLYQVFTISSGTTLGAVFGKSFKGAGELFDLFISKGPLGQAYVDELEMIVKMAMTNVKRTWLTSSFAENINPSKNVKGEDDSK